MGIYRHDKDGNLVKIRDYTESELADSSLISPSATPPKAPANSGGEEKDRGLAHLTVKDLDALIADEGLDVDRSLNKAEKIESIEAARG